MKRSGRFRQRGRFSLVFALAALVLVCLEGCAPSQVGGIQRPAGAQPADVGPTETPPVASHATQGALPSCSEELEQGAAKLAEGRLDSAAKEFERIAVDPQTQPFVRSLALFGAARIASEQKDPAGVTNALRRLASQRELPAAHRDAALRWFAEIEKRHKELPARDVSAYRAELPALARPALIIHVASDAALAGDGSEAKPFSSLSHARDALRRRKATGGGTLPKGGARVIVHGGEYPVSATLALAAEDSGTSNAPVLFQAEAGKKPVFFGSVRIRNWNPVSDPELRDKFDPSVVDRLFQADLAALGMKDFGDATALRQCPELFCNGVPQTLARWPNEGFVRTGDVLGTNLIRNGAAVEGCKDGKFRYLEDRPARWLDEPDVRLYGYWYWDWFEEFQKVASIDAPSHTFTLTAPFSNYGYRKDQRYRAVNVLREIDLPGEWYLDRGAARLYWLPPDGISPNRANVTLSCFAGPFISMENADHVILQGLTFQEGRADGIHIQGGSDCLVAGYTIRRFGGDAVVIEGGTHHGVFGCAINCMGCGGIRAKGGDRTTLMPGRHFVENCTVADISRIKRTYAPAVLLDGCGNRIAHNLFERMPSSAMRIEGNDQLIELNIVREAVQESDDQGGLDIFGNPLYRGVVIRWNQWADIGGGTRCGAAGVRLDDMISGVTIYGNVFQRCGSALFGGVQIHGGKDNLVDGNFFDNCLAGISFSPWGEKRWLKGINQFLPQAASAPYAQRYPDLARLTQDADMNFISRNLFYKCPSVFLRDAGKDRAALNLVAAQPIDPKTLSDERSIRKDPRLRSLLLDPIPFGEMGPYPHPWRASQ